MSQFVPQYSIHSIQQIHRLVDFLKKSQRLLVVTGAGASTESGIPDYRSPDVGLYARHNHKPLNYHQFIKSPETRQRYWCRNFVAWPRFSSTTPNSVHRELARWQTQLPPHTQMRLVTQNIDHLHHKAGSQNVLELHGTAYHVHCLSCRLEMPREAMQDLLHQTNPNFDTWKPQKQPEMAPDADVLLSNELIAKFKVPDCPSCGQDLLIPKIVFFGDNVPVERKSLLNEWCDWADSLLAVGTTMEVFSSYRIAMRMCGPELGASRKPFVIINIGNTRADHLASFKVETKAGPFLEEISKYLNLV